ncbi:MAG: hypothetical protein DME97_15520 [Verrucomicrobia bacterium]|nr:MAG: hypothetical protein DME97_15520 [Verrucomicrobiota bacterium]
MARKPKTTVEDNPGDNAAAPSANGKMNAPEPKKKARASAMPATKKKSAAAKKPSTKPPATSVAKPAASHPVEPTDDEIRLRAYFLAERRQKLSLPGDSAHDWIEARRQLIEEASRGT